MPVVCSRCSNHFEPGRPCPRCGAPSPVVSRGAEARGRGPRWQQTVVGRLLIGLVLAQGLFYGLRHLLTGVLLAVRETDSDLWADPRNVFLLFSIQLFAVFAGGVFAGGGQRLGALFGLLVGVWNGVAAGLLAHNPAGDVPALGFFTQSLLQAGPGLFGGLIGSLVWRPIARMPVAVLAPTPKNDAPRAAPLLAGPIAWGRVAAGCVAVIAASLYAAKLFDRLIDLTGNKFGTGDDFQDRLITWELQALLVLLGAVLSGAATKNGLKQGLVVGLLAGSILVGMQAPRTQNLAAMVVFTFAGTLCLCLAGGWFGGQLFPQVVSRRRTAGGAPSW